jgi:hypothetical protein
MSKAYDEGYSAFVDYNNYLVDGKNNPYPPSSKAHIDWDKGWLDGINEVYESEWADEDYYDDEEAEDYDDDEYLDDEDEDGYIEDIY